MVNPTRVSVSVLSLLVALSFCRDAVADIGFAELMVHDPVSGKPAPTALWYPTEAKASRQSFGPFVFEVAVGASPSPRARGAIVISHGSGGGSFSHLDTALALAEAGYVVAAPLHPGDNFKDDTRAASWTVLAGRPKTVSATIDSLYRSSRFGAALAGTKVGVFGFSAGGYTALALIGAKPEITNIVTHCQKIPSDGVCGLGIAWGTSAEMKKPMTGLDDRRVAAAAVLAPFAAPFGKEAFSEVTAPVILYRAEKDGRLSYPFHAEYVNRLLPTVQQYTVVKNAGHGSFLTVFPEAVSATLPAVLQDLDGFDRAAFHAQMNAEIISFFSRVLR